MVESPIAPRRAWWVLAVLAVAGSASALTYEENLDDDPKLPTPQRLETLDKRMQRMVQREADIGTAYKGIESAIAAGKKINAEVKEKQGLLRTAAGTTTVRAALGEGAPRGLAWHCSRAREILPQLARAATTASPALSAHSAQVRAVPIGRDDAVATLRAQYSQLQSTVTALIDSEEREQLRADLKEIDGGLQHAWGSYTTLRLMADETTKLASTLVQASTALDRLAGDIERQLTWYIEEKRIIRETLDVITPEYPADVAVRDSIRGDWNQRRLPGLKERPFDIVSGARFWISPWLATAEEAQTAAKDQMDPFADPARACGDWNEPVRDFAAARAEAQRSIQEQFIRIDEAYLARAEQLRQTRGEADEIRRVDEQTVAQIDLKLDEFRASGRTADTATREELDKAGKLRAEATTELGDMQRLIAALDAEAQVIQEQRAGMSTVKAMLFAQE